MYDRLGTQQDRLTYEYGWATSLINEIVWEGEGTGNVGAFFDRCSSGFRAILKLKFIPFIFWLPRFPLSPLNVLMAFLNKTIQFSLKKWNPINGRKEVGTARLRK